jgi:Xaa-Pro dipeptidase
MRVLELRYLEAGAPKALFVSAPAVTAQLRMIKDAGELAAMRRAAQIAQQGLLQTLPMVKAGVSERQIAAELTAQLLRAGADPELPFAPIVSSGPNGANPHATPSERILASGDLLVIDWGASYQGYGSDITRTFAIGAVEPEFAHIYELVAGANAAGRAAGRPGIPAGEVDRAARAVIDSAGYGAAFFHRLGHGLGMEDHEEPFIYDANTLLLAPGMTFTVEPGIYLTGRGGVRIEDDMVITEAGAESLTDLPRTLQML